MSHMQVGMAMSDQLFYCEFELLFQCVWSQWIKQRHSRSSAFRTAVDGLLEDQLVAPTLAIATQLHNSF